jgi:hypothetical protein
MLSTNGNEIGIGPMTVIEQRRQHPRYPLIRQPIGEFLLQTPAEKYPIKVINDISSSGIQIYLHVSLAALLQVAVEYVEPGLKVEVNGIVAWCAPRVHGTEEGENPGRFIIGIQLLSPMLFIAISGTY